MVVRTRPMTRCERRGDVNALRVSSTAPARHQFRFNFRDYGPAGIRDRPTTASAPRREGKTSSAPAARRVGSSNGKRFERCAYGSRDDGGGALLDKIGGR